MSKAQDKIIAENWKKFLKENIQEASIGSQFSRAAARARTARAMGFKPKGKGISAYPVSRQPAAALMAKGITKPLDPKDIEMVTITLDSKSAGREQDLGGKIYNVGDLATFKLESREVMIVDGQQCDIADQNWEEQGSRSLYHETVLWSLDTSDLYPSHDGASEFFFDETEEYSKFIELLKAAIADKEGTKGVIGECGVRMIHYGRGGTEENNAGFLLVKHDGFYPTVSKIVVGTMNVVSGRFRKNYFPSVVITFGDLPPGQQYGQYPYFFTPEGATEFLKIIEATGAEAISKFGSIYKSIVGTNIAIPYDPQNVDYVSVCKPRSAQRSQKATRSPNSPEEQARLKKVGLDPNLKF